MDKGDIIDGTYRIEEFVGEGAMGVVYRAVELHTSADVAIKFRKGDVDAERFMRESQIMAKVAEHPNVIDIKDIGVHERTDYFVMPFVTGGTLKEVLERMGPLNLEQAIYYFAPICDALDYMHIHGVVHRDLKLSNIMIDDKEQVLVMDLGLALDVERSRLTVSGQPLGTALYMSPEQAAGRTSEIGPPSDIYSLGIILYQLLTGEIPFTGDFTEILIAHVSEIPEPPSAKLAGLSDEIDEIILKALEKAPDDRYWSAGEFFRRINVLAWKEQREAQEEMAREMENTKEAVQQRDSQIESLQEDIAKLQEEFVQRETHDKVVEELKAKTEEYNQTKEELDTAQKDIANKEATVQTMKLDLDFVRSESVVIGKKKFFAFVATILILAAGAFAYFGYFQGDILKRGGAIKEPPQKTVASKLFTSKQLERTRSGEISAVNISADGKFLAVATPTGIELFNAKDLREVRPLKENVEAGNIATFSRNGKLLASYVEEETAVKLWNVASGKGQKTLNNIKEKPYSLVLNSDGSVLATAEGDVVKLWDTATDKLTKTLEGHTGSVESLAFSHNGSMLASGSWDTTVRIWNATTNTSKSLNGHGDVVSCLAFNGNANTLASGSWDATVKIWDANSGALTKTLEEHTGAITAIAFSPDGQYLASGGEDRMVKLWDVSQGTLKKNLSGHKRPIVSVTFSPDGRSLVSGANDGVVFVWNL